MGDPVARLRSSAVHVADREQPPRAADRYATLRAVSRRAIVLLLAWVVSCELDPIDLVFEYTPTVPSDVARIDLEVREACDDESAVLASQTFREDDLPSLDGLEPGRYAFSAKAYDANCNQLADVCQVLQLNANRQADVVITLRVRNVVQCACGCDGDGRFCQTDCTEIDAGPPNCDCEEPQSDECRQACAMDATPPPDVLIRDTAPPDTGCELESACTDNGMAGICKPGLSPGLPNNCCTGCWDGIRCRAGIGNMNCGRAGAMCLNCTEMGDACDNFACTDGACVAGVRQPGCAIDDQCEFQVMDTQCSMCADGIRCESDETMGDRDGECAMGMCCKGCRLDNGMCVPQATADVTDATCGQRGELCQTCQTNETCMEGRCHCPNCRDGGGLCVSTATDTQCGSGGAMCFSCGAGASCAGAVCRCDNGMGCYDSTTHTCVDAATASTSSATCGTNGNQCRACDNGQTCMAGDCQRS